MDGLNSWLESIPYYRILSHILCNRTELLRFPWQPWQQFEEPSTKVQTIIFLLAYVLYLVLGAKIFQALEEDNEINQRQSVVRVKADFMRHRSNLTQGDVEVFLQTMTYFIEVGILPTGNKTTALSWTFGNSFITSIIILSTIGYGTVFPITPRGQMFCVVFAAIGIPLTIVLFKYISKLVFLPFEKLGGYLEHNGVSKKYVSLWKIVIFTITGSLVFLLLPPFVFMSLENWTYVEGIYYSFTTISAIGLGDYAIVSNPMKETKSLVYSALLLIWNLHGLVWIALLFNLITEFCYEMESKLNAVSSEIEVGKEDSKSDAQNQCA